MKTTKKGLVLMLCTLVVMAITVAQATPETWNFSSPPAPGAGDVGSAKTYTGSSGDPLPASGFFTSNQAPSSGTWTLTGVTPTHMFEKFTSGDAGNTGLGLVSSLIPGGGFGANEIQPSTLVQLNFTSERSAGITNLTFGIGGLQAGEGFEIFGSNSSAANGAAGTLLALGTGVGTATVNFLGAIPNNFIWITAAPSTVSDVLLMNGLTSTPSVPEPTSLILVGCGLIGLVGYGRKKFLKK